MTSDGVCLRPAATESARPDQKVVLHRSQQANLILANNGFDGAANFFLEKPIYQAAFRVLFNEQQAKGKYARFVQKTTVIG